MPSKKHTSVVLNKEVQKIKNELAGIYGLKNLLSAGILLFSRQTDSKQKALIKEINHLNSVDDRLTPDTVLSYVKEISLAEGGYSKKIKLLSKEDTEFLNNLRAVLSSDNIKKRAKKA